MPNVNETEEQPKCRAVTAEAMAAKQRDISVSEFFAKIRHLLGFDNPRKALLTAVKEAVDNLLDACEEASIVPELWVHIEPTGTVSAALGNCDSGDHRSGRYGGVASETVGRSARHSSGPGISTRRRA